MSEPPRRVPHGEEPDIDAARRRLAHAQTELLSALVAGGPTPDGFDPGRLLVQRRALVAKRADVVSKVAPEPADILAGDFRDLFFDYARTRPMTDSYRRDATDFVRHLLDAGRPRDAERRELLTAWWEERTTPRPAPGRTPVRLGRLVSALRTSRAAR
ncbi:hypothetical protein FHS38_001362 [Streptomyces netropsis]|uniref:SCO6045-like C-terminal domain-containing protein n=1 Tax=Streptomyces netropsis TaxID=55404 RepID=A0A7W7PCU3_STRNE|nr:hypothetical protein [Streptomyces netropsis]GGR28384.1 hypothetical protein GCM10010219_36840 [Streptomyces netropsis]